MSDLLYLGVCAFEPKPYTRMDPLAVAEDGGWQVYSDWRKHLPHDGRAFAPRLTGFTMGNVLAFRVEPITKGENERDQLVLTEAVRVLEVLDFRKVRPEDARRALVEVGISSLMPGTKQIAAALNDGVCVVLDMVEHEQRWIADFNGLDDLPTHVLDDRLFAGDQVRGRWVAIPGLTVGAPAGVVNWCRDSDFLESALKRLRRAAPQGAPPPFTRAQVSQLVGYLQRAELTPASGVGLLPTLRRLQGFSVDLTNNLAAVDEAVDLVSALQPVQKRLEAELAGRREAMEAEVRKDLEARARQDLERTLGNLTTERDRLRSEVSDLEATAETRRRVAEDVITKAEAARGDLRDELSAILSELGEAAAGSEETAHALSARLGARLREQQPIFDIIAGPGAPWSHPRLTPGWTPKPWDAAAETLAASAARYGYSAEDLTVADIAARAGRLVVLPENAAGRFVRCYAAAIAGGDVVRHTLDPSVISVDDLWRQPGTGHPTGFGRAWAAARLDPRRYRVVVLDGIQRTPADLWGPGLIDILEDPRRPKNLLVFASVGPNHVDPDRVWRDMDRCAVAISPTGATGLSTETLARLIGRKEPVACFDALAAPTPSRTELAEFVESWEGKAEPGSLATMASAFCAAWSLGPPIATGAWAAALGGAIEAPADSAVVVRLQKYAAWLRGLSDVRAA